jgi:hypothetical protein
VLCANNHTSINAINVFLQSGTKLSLDNLGLILYQIKNDANYMDTCMAFGIGDIWVGSILPTV